MHIFTYRRLRDLYRWVTTPHCSCLVVLCLAWGVPAWSNDFETPDCIAMPLNTGASLIISGKDTIVESLGMRIANCRDAHFGEPSVAVRYISNEQVPLPRRYDSKASDKGVAVRDRIALSRSLLWFLDGGSVRPRVSPAANYAGILSSTPSDKGDIVLMLFPGDASLDLTAGVRPRNQQLSIISDPKNTPVQLKSVRNFCDLPTNVFVTCGLISSASTDNQRLFLADQGSLLFKAGERYTVRRGIFSSMDFYSIDPESAGRYLRLKGAPDGGSKLARGDRLDLLLLDASLMRATGDDKGFKVTTEDLLKDFASVFWDLREPIKAQLLPET